MAVFLIIALVAAAITKSVTNYRLDREYARQGLDSPRYKVRLAKLASAGLPPSGAAVARPGAKGYFRALWDDAWEDLTDRHRRIRDAKKAGERPTVGQRLGAAYRWAKSPIGERQAAELDRTSAERPAPAVEPTAGQAQPDGPVITCPDCGVVLRDVNGNWRHRPDSPCPLAATERPGQDTARRSTVHENHLDYVPGPHQTDPAADAEPNHEGEPDMTTDATGDVHDVESCKNELTALAEDLTRVDASLDVIDEAVRSIAAAAEQIEAWMKSKNLAAATIAGVSSVLDALGPDRVKELIDAVDSAKQGVQNATDGLAPLEEAAELVGAADGSALNNR